MHLIKKVLVFVLVLSFALCGVASGETTLELRLQDFTQLIYENYAAELFTEVYEMMYPSIHLLLSEEEYVGFQQHHFQRLRLSISKIEVGEVTTSPKLPSALNTFASGQDGQDIYGVALNYEARFVSGVRFKQNISKIVYLAVVNKNTPEESIYLLWDPSSMQEEEKDNDSN